MICTSCMGKGFRQLCFDEQTQEWTPMPPLTHRNLDDPCQDVCLLCNGTGKRELEFTMDQIQEHLRLIELKAAKDFMFNSPNYDTDISIKSEEISFPAGEDLEEDYLDE